jgi:hypothetical protein
MRKDKGLNGDLDRLPMLTWIMFIKFLDDMEQIRGEEAKISGKQEIAADRLLRQPFTSVSWKKKGFFKRLWQ